MMSLSRELATMTAQVRDAEAASAPVEAELAATEDAAKAAACRARAPRLITRPRPRPPARD